MPYEFKLIRQVEFHETDMAGIAHFSNFFRYMESAEHAFFRSLGFSIHERGGPAAPGDGGDGGPASQAVSGPFPGPLPGVAWPRVHARCDYRRPLHFEDRFEVHLLVKKKGRRSIRYLFIFRKLGPGPPVEVARGELTVVPVRYDQATKRMKGVALPPEIGQCLQEAPRRLLASDS